LRALRGDAQVAILAAAHKQSYDLVIVGRLHQALGRLLPGGAHSKTIAKRLEPSVLRVHGPARPIERILLASGGDHHTFDDVTVTAQLARPLGASVTLMHVLSQQSLLFEGFPPREISVADFLNGPSPEARTLREGSYDLLAIGAHRVTSALDRILLEDITGDLLDSSPLPVLVVKGAPAT
jgi:nucleotide-binding universal stress UspA family protein